MITFAPILNSSNNEKLIYTPILITIVLFCLQGLWLNKIHHAYMKQSMQTIQQLLSLSIAKESSLRNYSLPQNPKILESSIGMQIKLQKKNVNN